MASPSGDERGRPAAGQTAAAGWASGGGNRQEGRRRQEAAGRGTWPGDRSDESIWAVGGYMGQWWVRELGC